VGSVCTKCPRLWVRTVEKPLAGAARCEKMGAATDDH
jgi:hypothetical protein